MPHRAYPFDENPPRHFAVEYMDATGEMCVGDVVAFSEEMAEAIILRSHTGAVVIRRQQMLLVF